MKLYVLHMGVVTFLCEIVVRLTEVNKKKNTLEIPGTKWKYDKTIYNK